MRTRPLLWISLSLAAGAFCGVAVEPAWALRLAIALAGAAALSAVGARAHWTGDPAPGARRLAAAAVLLVSGTLGLARGAAAPRPQGDPALESWLADAGAALGGREPLLVEAEVREASPARGGARLLLSIERREPRPGQDLAPPPWPFAAEVIGPRGLYPGDRLRGLARLRLPEPPRNPGARDRSAALARRGVATTGTLEAEGLTLLSRGPAWRRWIGALRARFADRCAAVCSSPQRAALVAALGVGDRSGIDPALDEELSASGLVHLLSSAGLHLAAAAWAAQLALLAILSRLPGAGRRRDRAWAALLSLPAALGTVLLLGVPWPAVRAGAAAAPALSAPALGRRADALTLLAVSAAACGLLEPASLHELALQLSLLGVFGLIAVGPRLRELFPPAPLPPGTSWRARPLRRALEEVLRLFCQSLAASLCTAPLLAAAFHRVSLVAAAANALALWPGLLALPIAALAVPLDALAPPAALPPFWAADGLAGLTLQAAALFAGLPGAVLRTAAPGAAAAALWWALVALLAGLPGSIGRRLDPRRPPPGRRLLRASIPAGALLLLPLVRPPAPAGRLRATFFAVGQGDAALLQLPGGAAILVDGGGDLRGLPAPLGAGLRDPGARDLLPALAELGVDRLDAVVLTHPHPDHAGGLPAVLRSLGVGELWTTGEPGPGAIGDRVREEAAARGVRLRVPAPGALLESGGARIEALAPDPAWSPERSTNDNSLVLRVVHGEVALLLAGDAEALEEAQLAQGPRPLRAQLLKAGHHGSRTSTTEAFLRAVAPEVVVFSAGLQNPFGFPHPEVVVRARAAGAQILSTAASAVIAESDGRSLRAWQWRP